MGEMAFEVALRAARDTGDWSGVITGYIAAADGAPDARGTAFYLTHAYVHALEAADPRIATLKARLMALGAEVADRS